MNEAQAKQANTIRRQRDQLAALTKLAHDEREHGLQLLRQESDLKAERCRLADMLVVALLAMSGGTSREVVYFTKTRLTDELITLVPEVAERLGRKPAAQGTPA